MLLFLCLSLFPLPTCPHSFPEFRFLLFPYSFVHKPHWYPQEMSYSETEGKFPQKCVFACLLFSLWCNCMCVHIHQCKNLNHFAVLFYFLNGTLFLKGVIIQCLQHELIQVIHNLLFDVKYEPSDFLP